MKIIKRNYIHRNLILFLLSSIVFLEAIKAITFGQSLITDFSQMTHSWFDWVIITFNVLAVLSVYRLWRISDKFVFLVIGLMTFKNFYLLSLSFNKLVLGLSFVYLLFAFYFYVFWELELKRACFKPKFSKNDLAKSAGAILEVELVVNDLPLKAQLTNMDENSAFIIFNNGYPSDVINNLKAQDHVYIKSVLDGVEFNQPVVIVAAYDEGVGLDYLKSNSNTQVYDYQELFKIYLDRGYFI